MGRHLTDESAVWTTNPPLRQENKPIEGPILATLRSPPPMSPPQDFAAPACLVHRLATFLHCFHHFLNPSFLHVITPQPLVNFGLRHSAIPSFGRPGRPPALVLTLPRVDFCAILHHFAPCFWPRSPFVIALQLLANSPPRNGAILPSTLSRQTNLASPPFPVRRQALILFPDALYPAPTT